MGSTDRRNTLSFAYGTKQMSILMGRVSELGPFEASIQLNNMRYVAIIDGYHQKFQRRTINCKQPPIYRRKKDDKPYCYDHLCHAGSASGRMVLLYLLSFFVV